MSEKPNIIKDKSYNFSLDSIKLVRELSKSTESYIIAKQLVRCTTSIGANVEEALAGFSKKDFVHKMSIALKECSESKYWLRLIKDLELVSNGNAETLLNECEEIRKILTSIIKTSQEKQFTEEES